MQAAPSARPFSIRNGVLALFLVLYGLSWEVYFYLAYRALVPFYSQIPRQGILFQTVQLPGAAPFLIDILFQFGMLSGVVALLYGVILAARTLFTRAAFTWSKGLALATAVAGILPFLAGVLYVLIIIGDIFGLGAY